MKNGSELHGCTKTLTFEKPLCSRASPESPLAAWKALKVKLHRRALVGRFGSFLDLIRVWVGVRFRCPEVGLGSGFSVSSGPSEVGPTWSSFFACPGEVSFQVSRGRIMILGFRCPEVRGRPLILWSISISRGFVLPISDS